MSFSKRLGFEPSSKPLQLDSIDVDLKNSLWNTFYSYCYQYSTHRDANFLSLRHDILVNFLKVPQNSVSSRNSDFLHYIQEKYREFEWNKVYDFMEFLIGSYYVHAEYVQTLNYVLEREFSGYRVIDNVFAPISNDVEISEITTAMDKAIRFTGFDGVNIHLNKALQLISSKEKPDYGNSIKESVSAVETAARLITGEKTLGNALNKIEKASLNINNQLKESFNKIYNFTNDANSGIRHAVVGDHKPVDFETAKYILVTSSAFINYLSALGEKAGVFEDNRVL